ncbi:MAG: hypothetical protein ACRDU4_05645 [Mycobacterium sp.]
MSTVPVDVYRERPDQARVDKRRYPDAPTEVAAQQVATGRADSDRVVARATV